MFGPCTVCGKRFVSHNKLHAHLRRRQHYPREAKSDGPALAIIESNATITGDVEQGLLDFHFAQITAYFDEALTLEQSICADSGFGNSGIDRAFLDKIIEGGAPIKPTQLSHPRVVRGIGGGVETATHVALVPIYMLSGHVAVRIVAACFVFAALGCNLLLGNDNLV